MQLEPICFAAAAAAAGPNPWYAALLGCLGCPSSRHCCLRHWQAL